MAGTKINFIASVKDENVQDIEAIVRDLRSMGCNIDNVLSFTGIITGSASTKITLDDLKIKGIKSIELDRAVKAVNKDTKK